MIYLIDDNQNNQRFNNYNITFIEEGIFTGYFTSIEKLEVGKNFSDISNLEFLKTADCILLHLTTEDYDSIIGFLPGSKMNVIKIKEIISKEGEIIPLVLFSNSMSEAEFDFDNNPHYIPSIKKNLFYERLFDFIEHYKNTSKVELRIIAWGKNFAIKEISRIAIKILRAIQQKDNSDDLTISDLSSVLKDFQSFFKLAFQEIDVDEVLNKIEYSPMKIRDFKKRINQITESYAKYGRNIYTWE